jgi:hypothetical protein
MESCEYALSVDLGQDFSIGVEAWLMVENSFTKNVESRVTISIQSTAMTVLDESELHLQPVTSIAVLGLVCQ